MFSLFTELCHTYLRISFGDNEETFVSFPVNQPVIRAINIIHLTRKMTMTLWEQSKSWVPMVKTEKVPQ